MSETDRNQAEHEHISTSLEVEQIDTNLFRSKSLFIPARARGVFGGQVISQAVVSATNCVDPAYGLHSLHCYFLLSVSPAIPVLYYVERLREGRSYTTRSVKAVQNGRVVFSLLCSFQKPEPWQPSHQWPAPSNVPPPEECELEELRLTREAQGEDEKIKGILLQFAEERRKSPIAIKDALKGQGPRVGHDGETILMFWMQAKNIPKYDSPFQKAILGYMSDLYFIQPAVRALNLKSYKKGPDALAMSSSLDHSVHYYNDNFHCGEWILYVMSSPRTGFGRGIIHGRMYTRSGKLIAVLSQEALVRADRRPSTDGNEKARL